MKRLIVLAAVALAACGPARPAGSGDAPAPVLHVADKAMLEATRMLALAEIAYEPIATAALKLIEAGQIKGSSAGTVRDLNRTVTKAFKAAKAAQSAAAVTVELSRGLCCKHGARPRGVTQLGD